MPVGYENSGVASSVGDVDGALNVTADAGVTADRILFVHLHCFGASGASMTYNGVAMTLVDRTLNSSANGWWYLQNPASGSNTIAITGCSAGDILVEWLVVKNAL